MLAGGARVPGTRYELDPVQAAFNIGAMIRWLDFNDTWLAAEWGHPSDNLGAILAVADYLDAGRRRRRLTVRDVLDGDDQGPRDPGRARAREQLQPRRARPRPARAHRLAPRSRRALLGGTRDADRQRALERLARRRRAAHLPPRAEHRLAQELGRRRRDRAAACGSRCCALRGEMGYPAALTAPTWGFQRRALQGKPVALARPLGCYVMENVLFKISFPAEFHAQTAVEAAIKLHPQVRDRLDEIERIRIETQESAMRIIDKTGPLEQPRRPRSLPPVHGGGAAAARAADRGRLRGRGRARSADRRAARQDGRHGERGFTRDYLDPDKRSIGNAVQSLVRGRHAHRARRGRVSHRPPAPSRRRHSAARREVRTQSQPRYSTRSSAVESPPHARTRIDSRRCPSRTSWRCGSRCREPGQALSPPRREQAAAAGSGRDECVLRVARGEGRIRSAVSLGRGCRQRFVRPAGPRDHDARRRARGRAAHHRGDAAAAARRRRYRVRQRVQHRAHRARDGTRGSRRRFISRIKSKRSVAGIDRTRPRSPSTRCATG